ncbi:hypothetical protein TNCV_2958991 [Trichonephila clavipes]|nr:hypothetical protein TNCV_2958991 [Trichonephila clavipes]
MVEMTYDTRAGTPSPNYHTTPTNVSQTVGYAHLEGVVTIGTAFQVSITAEDLDRGSEKASPVFKHPFGQTTPVQASMCEWSSYPAGREMGLPGNIAIELGVQHCPECPHTSQSSCFQSQELTD